MIADALKNIRTHNGQPLSPTNLRWAAAHEALCRSFIFDVLIGLADALERGDPLDTEGWASYAAEQERHAETQARLDLMTREARLSREATEKAVQTRVARHEIERALRAADAPEDSMATDEDLIHYQGRAEAVEIVRIMLGWTDDEIGGLHSCVGCGLELDADDQGERCDDCAADDPAPICACGHHKVMHTRTSPRWCLMRGGCDCHEYEGR